MPYHPAEDFVPLAFTWSGIYSLQNSIELAVCTSLIFGTRELETCNDGINQLLKANST